MESQVSPTVENSASSVRTPSISGLVWIMKAKYENAQRKMIITSRKAMMSRMMLTSASTYVAKRIDRPLR